MKTTNAKVEPVRNQEPLEIADSVLKIALALVTLFHGEAATFGAVAGKMLLTGTVVLQLANLFRRLFPRAQAKDSTLPRRFAQVVCKSKCPFAKKATLLGATLDPLQPLDDGVKRIEDSLIGLTQIARKKRLDGFVIEITDPRHTGDLGSFCRAFNTVLRTLVADDPARSKTFEGDILAPKWQFSFNGTRFFITTFAPFYGIHHPRWSHSVHSAFIYLQPEFSFDHHGIHVGNSKRENLKNSIRRDFIDAGYHLDVTLIEQPHEAFKYIKPLTVGAKPVRWWESDAICP